MIEEIAVTVLPRTPLSSRAEFVQAVHDAIGAAAKHAAIDIIACDRTFSDWPLGDRGFVDALTRWAGPRRRLLLVAHSFDDVSRRHGRWTEWRRHWSHLVECRSNPVMEAGAVPTLLLVPGFRSVRLLDPVQHRGIASSEAGDEMACREAIDAVLQHSIETFPVTTLGL